MQNINWHDIPFFPVEVKPFWSIIYRDIKTQQKLLNSLFSPKVQR